MYTALIVLIILVAVILTFVVLVQNSKGGGLAAGFQSSNQIMGVRKTTDFIEKATWTLAGLMIIMSILAVGIGSRHIGDTSQDSLIKGQSADITRKIQEGTATPNFGEVPQATESDENSQE